jgi:hypothetical protein
MAPSSLIKLAAALALIAPLIMGNPIAGSQLDARQCTTDGMTISSCTSCTGDESPVCTTSPYRHLGGENECSCDDEEVPFNGDYCTVSGGATIPTPFGDGNWEEADGCNAGNAVGTPGGTIVPADGTSTWSCSCVNGMGSCADDCGLEYSCTEVWNCACSQC